jgi:hypothetical protein
MMSKPKPSQFGWLPIVSSGFGYDPFAVRDSVRMFYERWHTQGGESARDHCGIMKRAHDMPDLRTYEFKALGDRALSRLRNIRGSMKTNVVQFTRAKR